MKHKHLADSKGKHQLLETSTHKAASETLIVKKKVKAKTSYNRLKSGIKKVVKRASNERWEKMEFNRSLQMQTSMKSIRAYKINSRKLYYQNQGHNTKMYYTL